MLPSPLFWLFALDRSQKAKKWLLFWLFDQIGIHSNFLLLVQWEACPAFPSHRWLLSHIQRNYYCIKSNYQLSIPPGFWIPLLFLTIVSPKQEALESFYFFATPQHPPPSHTPQLLGLENSSVLPVAECFQSLSSMCISAPSPAPHWDSPATTGNCSEQNHGLSQEDLMANNDNSLSVRKEDLGPLLSLGRPWGIISASAFRGFAEASVRMTFFLCSFLPSFPNRYVSPERSPINPLHATVHLRVCFQVIWLKTLFFALFPLRVQFRKDPEVEFGELGSGYVSSFSVGLVVYQLVLVGSLWGPKVPLSASWSPQL